MYSGYCEESYFESVFSELNKKAELLQFVSELTPEQADKFINRWPEVLELLERISKAS